MIANTIPHDGMIVPPSVTFVEMGFVRLQALVTDSGPSSKAKIKLNEPIHGPYAHTAKGEYEKPYQDAVQRVHVSS